MSRHQNRSSKITRFSAYPKSGDRRTRKEKISSSSQPSMAALVNGSGAEEAEQRRWELMKQRKQKQRK
uniref:Uncharacterized protein n=1 Tax=Kalanchoe fedtschenkoi TaxID=63787 RepID=A0A7N0VJH0_KALFE